MVGSQEAREQYHRVLGIYEEAKVIVLQCSIRSLNYTLSPLDANGKFSVSVLVFFSVMKFT